MDRSPFIDEVEQVARPAGALAPAGSARSPFADEAAAGGGARYQSAPDELSDDAFAQDVDELVADSEDLEDVDELVADSDDFEPEDDLETGQEARLAEESAAELDEAMRLERWTLAAALGRDAGYAAERPNGVQPRDTLLAAVGQVSQLGPIEATASEAADEARKFESESTQPDDEEAWTVPAQGAGGDREVPGVFDAEEHDRDEAQLAVRWSTELAVHEDVDPANDPEWKLIEWALLRGGSPSENIITDHLFQRRHPELKGRALRASEKALIREWRDIRDKKVHPYIRHSLRMYKGLDPVLLATYLSQYEDDDRVPADARMEFLLDPPKLSMGRSLRDRVLRNWSSGQPPLTVGRFFDLAYGLCGNVGYAALLCHNVAKAFSKGGKAIHWQKLDDGEGRYTGSGKNWTARRIHPRGVLLRSPTGPSIFYVLFSAKEFGTVDHGDWYHHFVAATMTSFGTLNDRAAARAAGHIRGERRETLEANTSVDAVLNERPNPARMVERIAYPILLRDALSALTRQMSVAPSAATAGHTGWVFANGLSFLEGAFYGKSQQEVARESRTHLRGAIFGVKRAGEVPHPSWRWFVPKAGSVGKLSLVSGFSLADKTAEVLSASPAPKAAVAAGTVPAASHGHGR